MGLIRFLCVKTKVSQEGTLLKKSQGLRESLESRNHNDLDPLATRPNILLADVRNLHHTLQL